MHRNTLALNKLPLRQENDNLSKRISDCIFVLLRPKRIFRLFPVIKIVFPEIVKMDLRNGLTFFNRICLIGYE